MKEWIIKHFLSISTAYITTANFQLELLVFLARFPLMMAAIGPAGRSSRPKNVVDGIIHATKLPKRAVAPPIHGPSRIPTIESRINTSSILPLPPNTGIPGSLEITAYRAAKMAITATCLDESFICDTPM